MKTDYVATILGAVLGFMSGGGRGALIGGLIGFFLDRSFGGFRVSNSQAIQRAFFAALFPAMGRIAKSDGRVSEAEVRQAENVMRRMRLSREQRREAIKLYGLGKRGDFALDEALSGFSQVARMQPNVRQVFLEILVDSAFADGVISKGKIQLLVRYTQLLRVSAAVLEHLLARAGHGNRSQPGVQKSRVPDPYQVLGIARGASEAQVKRAYRKLISQHHPDKLVAKGLPKEMMQIAEEKTRQIRAAYEQIMGK